MGKDNRLGNALKQARLMAFMTQEEAAAKSRLSRTTITNYEKGNSIPSIIQIMLLAEVYGVEDYRFLLPAPKRKRSKTMQ